MATLDEQRAKCIEAIAEAATISVRRAAAAFYAINGLAWVEPIEATEEMIDAAEIDCVAGDVADIYRTMAAIGDLTNEPEKKP